MHKTRYPWKELLDVGNKLSPNVFHPSRRPCDIKDKARNMRLISPRSKSDSRLLTAAQIQSATDSESDSATTGTLMMSSLASEALRITR
jgi:hypothetical protein